VNVWLYRVGRNLNRAYRTCEAFGVTQLFLIECDPQLSGSLFQAADRVEICVMQAWPSWPTTLALETSYPAPLWSIPFAPIQHLLLGGETAGLPVSRIAPAYRAHIPQQGKVSGLTVEAALAIALYEWRRQQDV